MNTRYRIIMLLLTLVALGCSPKYTAEQAKDLFGCKITGTTSDTIIRKEVDSVWTVKVIPGDTVKVQSPCEEMAKMQPGQKKSVKSKSLSVEYGKDSTGRSFFNCLQEEYKDSMLFYKERWYTTVLRETYQTQLEHQPKTGWQLFVDKFRDVMMFLGLIAIVVLTLKVWKGS